MKIRYTSGRRTRYFILNLIFQLLFYHPPAAVVIRFTVFTVSMIIYLTLMNFFAQLIINKTEEVFNVAYYDTDWYLLPIEFQRMILLIQKSATKRKALTAAKMGEASLEAAGIVIELIITIIYFGRKMTTLSS